MEGKEGSAVWPREDLAIVRGWERVLGRKAEKRLQPEVSYREEEAAIGEWALFWELGMGPGQEGKE